MAREPSPPLDGAATDGIVYRTAWRRSDQVLRAKAKALWRELGILPPGADPEERADQLCVAAFDGEQLAGVCTAVIDTLPQVRQKIALLRMLVAPAWRDRRISRQLTNAAYDVLERWSLDHPEAALMGTGVIVQNPDLHAHRTFAISPTTGLALIGYTRGGERIRVAWFPHAQI